ncbi:uncharacterized protein E0L32_009568 [Thyridium curvatum]|uniref:Uncharacterized protein n=1 Tax=Thyridium curvatum TaxID=1093900 RepID=A0A507AVL7_9PEZI|nr:uncharacterized protein E0L32_009568 [Thyridium curvatum]TPX08989.1 hypothetical protein E0L32_009568 [Thyridium curvatum]
MSGVELIVGAVLGAIPIALEAYDRSGRVFQVFSTSVKRYPSEVLLLETRLGAQKAIFRNNAVNLLTAITKDRVRVQEVLDKPSSDAAKAGLVMSSLLGLTKPHITKAIDELRDFNQDFGLITDHIIKALHSIADEPKDEGPVRKSARSLNVLQPYHRFRDASKALYSMLQMRWVCQSHKCHCFDVRILDSCTVATSARYVTCELAITHDGSNYGPKAPLRLEVQQSCVDGDDEEDDSIPVPAPAQKEPESSNMQQLTAVLEAGSDKFVVRHSKAQPKKGSKDPPTAIKTPNNSGAPQLPSLELATQSMAALQLDPDADASDICRAFHDATIAMSPSGRLLLDSWRSPDFGSAQWFCVPPTSATTTATAALGTCQSLSDLVAWIAQDPIFRALPRGALFGLAGAVAEGIMQFYSTPWLPADLGRSVRYFHSPTAGTGGGGGGGGGLDAGEELQGPYFMTRLETYRQVTAAAKGKGRAGGAGGTESVANASGARNKLLFSFGILLLEIGYGRPWAELRREVLAKLGGGGGEDGGPADWRAAEKLAHLLVRQMGPTYPRIVRKCLGCDFGLGETDLDNEDLQRRFLDDVVAGLRRLGEEMRLMSSG